MPLPTVGILMSLYRNDRLDFFAIALQSLQTQSYPSELLRIYLVIDGPIPDEHEQFLKKWQSCFYRIVRLPETGGLANALNADLEIIEDEKYYFRMDGDDYSLPDRVMRQVTFMDLHPETDLTGCNATDIDHAGRKLRERVFPEQHEEIIRAMPRLNPILHPTYCIRGESLRRDQPRYPDAHLTEDWAFLFQVAVMGWRLHNLNETLLHWRTGDAFFRRRFGVRRGVAELKTTFCGTWSLFGASPALCWSIIRLGFRLLPPSIAESFYRSGFRKILFTSQAGNGIGYEPSSPER